MLYIEAEVDLKYLNYLFLIAEILGVYPSLICCIYPAAISAAERGVLKVHDSGKTDMGIFSLAVQLRGHK
jgi:hypothetical protein